MMRRWRCAACAPWRCGSTGRRQARSALPAGSKATVRSTACCTRRCRRHPGHALWQRDFAGSSGLFSFVLKRGTRQQLGALIDDLAHFGIGFSWGGFESLALPVKMDGCRSVTTLPFTGPIVRLSIGLEDPVDLIADLAAGLARYEAAL